MRDFASEPATRVTRLPQIGMISMRVDLSEPETAQALDSCGLSVLISVKKLLDQDGAKLLMAGPSPMIKRLMVITKLDRVFDITAED